MTPLRYSHSKEILFGYDENFFNKKTLIKMAVIFIIKLKKSLSKNSRHHKAKYYFKFDYGKKKKQSIAKKRNSTFKFLILKGSIDF